MNSRNSSAVAALGVVLNARLSKEVDQMKQEETKTPDTSAFYASVRRGCRKAVEEKRSFADFSFAEMMVDHDIPCWVDLEKVDREFIITYLTKRGCIVYDGTEEEDKNKDFNLHVDWTRPFTKPADTGMFERVGWKLYFPKPEDIDDTVTF